MSWLILAFASAVFLGFYDLAKKKSVQDNAVRPVLCLCSAFYALFMLPVLLTGHCEPISLHDHLLLMAKAVIVGLSWLFTYNAIAHMPLSISTTIRALAPLFTIMIAVGFMGERPFALQWVGIAICVCSYIGLSMAGRKEMGHFFSNGWVVSMLIGTILASCSGIYDKFILQRMNFEPMTVQVWFSIYMLAVQFITTAFTWFPTRKKTKRFVLYNRDSTFRHKVAHGNMLLFDLRRIANLNLGFAVGKQFVLGDFLGGTYIRGQKLFDEV